MKIMLDDFAYEPIRAYPNDAGLDLRAAHGAFIRAGQTATIHTGVHVELPEGTAGVLLPKSGLMMKHNIVTFGVIDAGYRGEIQVHMFNHGQEDYAVIPGDKISQMLVLNVRYEPVELVDRLSDGERGDRGYGSTGR